MTATAAHIRAQAKYQKKPIQVKKREARNLARRHMEKLGLVRKGDGKDVNHKDGNALHNVRGNWNVESQKKNRTLRRNKKAGKRHRGANG
jgi:hypothetical protein